MGRPRWSQREVNPGTNPSRPGLCLERRIPGNGLIPCTKMLAFHFRQAVKDTAASRVVLFGTSAFIPEVFSHFFVR